MNIRDFQKKVRPDLFFFIVGFLVFPAVIIISVFSIFSNSNENLPVVSFPIDNPSVTIDSPSIEDHQLEVNNEEQLSEDQGASSDAMTSSISTVRTGHSEIGLKTSEFNQESINSTGVWSATQYTSGDIVKDTYVVQLGDTLWQIANAYYGNGNDWMRILENNQDSIGHLPNGEQALIFPDQILILP